MVSKTYKNTSTIASNAILRIDPTGQFDGTKDFMKKFAPYNSLFVSNEDSNTIEVYPNGSTDKKFILPLGATRNLLTADGTLDVFRYIDIKNIGSGTVAANAISVRIGREGK